MNMNYTDRGGDFSQPQPRKKNILGIFSLILGILGMVYVPACGIAAIVTAYAAKKEHGAHSPASRAGLILGWVGFGLFALLCAILISVALAYPDLMEKFLDLLEKSGVQQ